MKNKTFNISGRVIDCGHHQGVPGLRVEAWDKDLVVDDALGNAVTNSDGFFGISFDESAFRELFLDKKPDLYFKIYKNNHLVKSTRDRVMWNVSTQDIDVVIEVDVKSPHVEHAAHSHNHGVDVKSAATTRRADALFKAMSTDFLLREQFITDPSQVMSEFVHGKRLSQEQAAVSNQLLYSVMSNQGLLQWFRDYSIKLQGRQPSREKLIVDLSRAVVDNKGHHVLLALARSAAEKQSVYSFDEVLLPVFWGIFKNGGLQSGTEMSTGTYATEQSGTHISGGIFQSGTEMSTGTYATEQSGTHISGGIYQSGTEMSTGTYATEQSGTHISGGIYQSGTEMSTGTYATEQSGTHISGGIFQSGTEMSTGTYATEQSGTHISGGIFQSGTEMSTGTYATEQSGTHISGGIFQSGTEMSTGTYATEQSGTHMSGGIINARYAVVTLEALVAYSTQLKKSGALDSVFAR